MVLSQTYTDHGISGASLLRPGYQQLLTDARSGMFDVVVAESIDRLSRDQEHIAAFQSHEVRMHQRYHYIRGRD